MALGYQSARVVAVSLTAGGLVITLIAWVVFQSSYLYLVAAAAGIALTVSVGLIFGWDTSRQDLIEELTDSEPGSLDEESNSEFVRQVEAVENPGRPRDWPARDGPP